MPTSRRHPLARPTILDAEQRRGTRRPWTRPGWWIRENSVADDPLGRSPELARVEAALFATEEPLPPRRLALVAAIEDVATLREILAQLQTLYELDGSAFQVTEVAGGFQLLTRPEFHPWLARLNKGTTETKLSGAARETLTIVAYRQPITRGDLESIRGVQSGDVLKQLMERGLVRIAGRDTTLGRPVLYGTTKKFLQVYGLKSLRDLPAVPDLTRESTKEAEA